MLGQNQQQTDSQSRWMVRPGQVPTEFAGMPRTMAEALAQSQVTTATQPPATPPPENASGRKSHARNANRRAALGILWHAWPRGKPAEGPAVLAALLLALGQLLSWLATFVLQLIFAGASVLARELGALARTISGQRLGTRGSAIIGWILAVTMIVATGTAIDLNRVRILDRFIAQPTRARIFVPYQPPPSACSLPRGVCAPPTEVLDGQPSISAAEILSVLASYHSPAATPAFASALYDLGIQYGVNPAYGLGFFIEESQAGTQGLAVTTLSLGNVRYSQSSSPVSYTDYQGFRQYASWRDGAEDWYWVIRTYYLNKGVRDIYDVTPIYAPSTDNNDPNNYARTVYDLVLGWHS